MKFTKDSIQNNRRKLLYWAAGTLSGLILWRFNKKVEPDKPAKPVRMLTEDGQLVEVDARFLGGTGRKINPKEIQTWVKHKL